MEETSNLTISISAFKGSNIEKSFYNPTIIEKAVEEQQYADVIYMHHMGVLMLRRSKEDSFEPNKLCLPGGKIDPGETPKFAAIREMLEETGLDIEGEMIVATSKIGPCNYFLSFCSEKDPIIILDEDEHYQYVWMSHNDIVKEPAESFILNLKKRLCEMLHIQS
jgi:8-oxo-dGTP pyrophosphatase MutT (NUDIX family)